jgi:hypothetical protein
MFDQCRSLLHHAMLSRKPCENIIGLVFPPKPIVCRIKQLGLNDRSNISNCARDQDQLSGYQSSPGAILVMNMQKPRLAD